MKIALFSTDINITNEWQARLSDAQCYVLSTLEELQATPFELIIADFDTVSAEINTLFSLGKTPKGLIVLERVPANATGKMLIQNGVMAYGNTHMLQMHLNQLISAVTSGKIWVYPELLKSIIQVIHKKETYDETLMQRLSPQEKEVATLILKGLSNNAIADQLDITTRTVKAHISSIFSKLHVKDRLNLVLLLKA